MEAVGLTLSVVQTLLAAFQNPQLKHIFSIFGYESQLEKLRRTVYHVNAVLRDAQRKEELSDQEKHLVEKLKEVVYDADDLFDRLTTLTEQEQLHLLKKRSKVPKKVRRLISRFGKLSVAYDMTREAKKIWEMLEEISSDASKFNIQVDNRVIASREETCSYVYQQDIVGREDDARTVIDMLLDADSNGQGQGNVSALSIVGMGGLGKTALAQLVFNDDRRIKENFSLRLWVCVADEGKKFDVNEILVKILESATSERGLDDLGIERLQKSVREKLAGKKFLLVLDNVWTEDRIEWMKLESFMKGLGCRGSQIVVTTRSVETAKVVGRGGLYMLKGLSDEGSWQLFKMVALGQEQEHLIPSDFVLIGRDVVKKCMNVPLAIRVVGALLFNKDKEKWLTVRQKGLACIGRDKNDIHLILKLSYHQLDSPLKSCFSYCALFPKDSVMKKEMLIRLWMAQGYLEPLDGDQSMESVGEEYFLILLHRCFFQDVRMNQYDEIISCKIHDLMYDIAQEVAGREICIADFSTSRLDKETRHVHHHSGQHNYFFSPSRSRTFLHCKEKPVPDWPLMNTLLANWKWLRALCLSHMGIQVLPDTIGELLHLRYLNLSSNKKLKMLPASITKLCNLQTLDLEGCKLLKVLPQDLSKLVKLRVLNITGCLMLSFMPSGIERLTSLSRLTMFVLGVRSSSLKHQQQVGEMQELQDLRNLKGNLNIRIMKNYSYVKGKGKGGYLCSQEKLTHICIKWIAPTTTEGEVQGDAERLLDDLQPHPNLRGLELIGYNGSRIARWAREDNLITFLPNLSEIEICRSPLLELPLMSKLPFLKTLRLHNLYKLQYVENIASFCCVICSGEAAAVQSNSRTLERESSPFFPSLEVLTLGSLPMLQGWWRKCRLEVRDDQLPSFPHLQRLFIYDCPNLICMPLCPTVGALSLYEINEGLRIMAGDEKRGAICSSSSTSNLLLSELSTLPNYDRPQKLRDLRTNTVGCLKHLPSSAVCCLDILSINGHQKQSLTVFGEVFGSHPIFIRCLEINMCRKLSTLSGVLEHLSGLENLSLYDIPNLMFDDTDEDDGMPWKSFAHTLNSLRLCKLPRVVKLPKGVRHLTSLRRLEMIKCSLELKKRCQKTDGQDWPIIQHVPDISIRTGW